MVFKRVLPRLLLTTVLAVAPCFAKRAAPKAVAPAFSGKYRFEAPLDDGQVARVEAFDRQGGLLVWTVVVFTNKMDPRREDDVQWRFISKLEVVGETLEVTAEDAARYRVNISTRKVEKLPVAESRP